MVYCKNCGKILDDAQKQCPHCGQSVSEATASIGKQGTDTGAGQRLNQSIYQPEHSASPYVTEELGGKNMLSNGIKVVLTALVCLVAGIGPIVGVIVGIVFMGKPDVDYKGFGKALLILSSILLGFCILCCTVYGIGISAFSSVADTIIESLY